MTSNKKIGNGFEKRFSFSGAINGWRVTRIPDGCRQLGLNKIVRVKSPFDFLLTKAPTLSLYCDAKTTIGDRFTYSAINQDQLSELLRIENSGHVAGFVIEFRQVDKVCFASASKLALLTPRESLKWSDCVDLGKELDVDLLFSPTRIGIETEDALA